MTPLAITNLEQSGSYDVAAIQSAWERGDYGTLTDYGTGEAIRPATRDEALESYEAGPEGAIESNGRSVYVQP
jgi:hypothetical protein